MAINREWHSNGECGNKGKKVKGKSEHLYNALHGTNHSKALRHGSHSFQPAKNTMPAFTSYAFTRWRLHWMWWQTSNCSPLLIYRPREDERLSWFGWLTYSERLTHISGHPSATGRVQDGERTLARDWRSTAEPHGPTAVITVWMGRIWRWYCGDGSERAVLPQ